MTLQVNKRPLAERDLEDIWFYTYHSRGPEAADAYLGSIDLALFRLLSDPLIGQDYGWCRAGLRRLTVKRQRVFYMESAASVDVVRVLHERMDVTGHLALA